MSLWFLVCLLFSVANGNGVPGFTGQIVMRDQAGYEEAAYQYATTSMPDGTMRPLMILFAVNDNDVIAAINYARRYNVALAVRTGGHQYSGSSSTSGNNIQLDLSRTYVEFEFDDYTSLLRVGISWALRELDARMGSMGLFVPHGQCSHVHVGGHAQTGGWGSLLRGFGLFGDHIQSFEIITADGQKRTVRRNAGGADERDLFYAVLGGSPGNYGVLTHVTLRVHRNSDHPDSRGLYGVYLYNKATYKAMLDVLVEMAVSDDLSGSWDATLTLVSPDVLTDLSGNSTPNVDQEILTKLNLLVPAAPQPVTLLVLWVAYSNVVPGVLWDPTSSSNWFKRLTDAAQHTVTVATIINPSAQTNITTLNAAFALRNVREFVMPYSRSGRVTDSKTLANDGWTDFIADRVDTVLSTPNSGLHLNSQFLVLGGKHSKFAHPPAGETAYSWRNSNAIFTMDAFYEPSETARNHALAYEQAVAQCVGVNGSWSKTDRRVLWASFGDHNMANVWPFYHECQTKYDRLVRIKRHVDPMNVFTPNEFCVGVDGKSNPQGKKAPAGKVSDAVYAPKLQKKRDCNYDDLLHPKKTTSGGSSGKSAAIACIPVVGAGAVAIFIRRRRIRSNKQKNTNKNTYGHSVTLSV